MKPHFIEKKGNTHNNCSMRLNRFEKAAIVQTVESFDSKAKIYLFGSRCDDEKRGGDIDLALVSDKITSKDKTGIRLRLYDLLGEQKIDIVTGDTQSPFMKKALTSGILINE